MATRWSTLRTARLAVAVACAVFAAAPAHALKVATWNMLNLDTGTNTITGRQPAFRTVLAAMSPDILTVQEMHTAEAYDSILVNTLNVVEPGQWVGGGFFTNAEGAVYWKPSKVAVVNVSSIGDGGPRQVLVCLVKPVGYASNAAWFRLYSFHLKAGGPGTPDSTTRRAECTTIRTTLNNQPTSIVGTNFIIGGDSNFYSAFEGGYIRLTESQTNNNGRCKDPLDMPGIWTSNSAYAVNFTQCPCITGNCPSGYGFSGGGLDDRFDLLLTSYPVQDGQGLDLVGYAAYGNDGQHFNDDIDGGGFNNAVGFNVANALHNAADHIPVLLTLQLPAQVVAASQLDFGSVIVGAAAPQQSLAVSNGAGAPADALDYSLVAPAGFTAPGGAFSAAAGAAANLHTLSMNTGASGALAGTLTVSSDAPDSVAKPVLLSGRVLRHAVASLDSEAVVAADTLDFGVNPPGLGTDREARVHDQGWDALQARLSITSGTITGGEGRFSIVGGFAPALVGGTGRTYTLHFDDTGATADSTYFATLTVGSSDEALPGATARPDLVLTLEARVSSGPSGVEPGAPTAVRFYAPRPNPVQRQTRFAFDLPAPAHVTLDVYDLSGRRVARLTADGFGAGHHELHWNATDDRGARVQAGLYFARFGTAGYQRMERIVLLP